MPQPLVQEPIPSSYQEQAKQGHLSVVPTDPWLDEERQRLFDFQRAKINLKSMIDMWGMVIYETELNRSLRKLDIDPNVLQAQGKIDSDETVITIRTIDTNVKRELPTYVSYTQQARRIVTFTDRNNPSKDCQVLEEEFSRGMTYEDWMSAHNKTVDGTLTHGWDSCEVVYDEDKPLHVAIEHIGHAKLIFPLDAINIQACETLIRVYTITQSELKTFGRRYGFNTEQIKLILDVKGENKKNDLITIYKQLFKFGGIVHVAWFDITVTNDWLNPPKKLFVGRRQLTTTYQKQPTINPMTGQPTIDPLTGNPLMSLQPVTDWQDEDITKFPIFLFPYEDMEDDRIIMNKGRVFLDKPCQEAQTAIWSAAVNGYTRASQVFGSPRQGMGGRPKVIEDARFIPGRMLSEPFDFWHTDPPDPGMVSAAQALAVQNSQEAGQINYAANNRVDSRKTAKEIEQGQQDQNLLKSVQVTNYSAHLRKEYAFAWTIVQSQALQGKIQFLVNPETGQPDTQMVAGNYDIRAAGDIDVIQRIEKINRMKQDWPVISQTPLAIPFLLDLIRISYPDDYSRYAAIMQAGDQKAVVIQQLLTVLQGALDKEDMMKLSPQAQQQAMAIIANAQKVLAGPTGGDNQQGQQQPKPQEAQA